MATDNNTSPVANSAGTLDFSSLESDLSGINQKYDSQIQDERGRAEDLEAKAVEQAQRTADAQEAYAKDESSENQAMDAWLNSQPTKQASYATTMHAAPMLAILTALGGKLTRLNGMQMLAATNGIVQGMNQAAENQYNDAYNAWQASYQKMKEHQAQLMRIHQQMLQAYAGRADAYQKAADAARRMTGDLLDAKQSQLKDRLDLFKAQSEAINRLDRVKYSYDQLHERQLKDIQQQANWKKLHDQVAKDPKVAAQLTVNHQRWQNFKGQADILTRQRGQINASLSISDEDKKRMLSEIDDKLFWLDGEMDRALSDSDALARSMPNGPLTPPDPNAPNPRPAPTQTPTQRPATSVNTQLPAENGKGGKLMRDAKTGTMAYVYPDGHYEVVQSAPTTVQ